MLTKKEIVDIQNYYSGEEELVLLEEAMYFQKFLIQKFQFDNVRLRLNAEEEGGDYSVSVKEEHSFTLKMAQPEYTPDGEEIGEQKFSYQTLFHMLFYSDYINLQMVFFEDIIMGDIESFVRKAKMLLNRTKYLKEVNCSDNGGNILIYLWTPNVNNFSGKQMEMILKEFLWLQSELCKYAEERASKLVKKSREETDEHAGNDAE